MSNENLQEVVKQKYGAAAKQVAAGGVASCGAVANSVAAIRSQKICTTRRNFRTSQGSSCRFARLR